MGTAVESLLNIEDIPRAVRTTLRDAHYIHGIPQEAILREYELSPAQLNAILSEPDDMDEYRLHKFTHAVNTLYDKALMIAESIDEGDIRSAKLHEKASAVKSLLGEMQRIYEIQQLRLQGVGDHQLAILLAMDRNDARDHLMERFRQLSRLLFSGVSGEQILQEIGLVDPNEVKTVELPREVEDETSHLPASPPPFGGSEKVVPLGRPADSNDGGRGKGAPSRIGAFRGPKDREPS